MDEPKDSKKIDVTVDDTPKEDEAKGVAEVEQEESTKSDEKPVETPAEMSTDKPEPTSPVPAALVVETKSEDHPTSAGIVVLQWLTYAFWGWAIIALLVTVALVLVTFIMHESTSDAIPYAIASMLVLFPIAIGCDLFYSRSERGKKVGASMLIMVIHAVIFALCGIGALIVGIWLIVALSIGQIAASDVKLTTVAIMTALIIAGVYAITFVRTINPFKRPIAGLVYTGFMTALGLLFIVLCFVGPVADSARLKNDRLIESNIGDVRNGIEKYTISNEKLPKSLADIELESDAKQLVDEGLVSYTPGQEALKSGSKYSDDSGTMVHKYTLCTTYTAEKGTGRTPVVRDSYYGVDTSNHPSGKTCYDLETSTYPDTPSSSKYYDDSSYN